MPNGYHDSLGGRIDEFAAEALRHPIRSAQIGMLAVGGFYLAGKGADFIEDRWHDLKEGLHDRIEARRMIKEAHFDQ